MIRRRILVGLAAPVVMLAILDLAGARAFTGALAGLEATGPRVALGLAYAATWLLTVLVVPAAVLGLLTATVIQRMTRRRR